MVQNGNMQVYDSTAEIQGQLQKYEKEYGYTARDAERKLTVGEIAYTTDIIDWLALQRHWNAIRGVV
jgi:hypothetical protein